MTPSPVDDRTTENWYALRVRSNHEKVVQAGLRHRGLDEFLPVYRVESRWSDRIRQIDRPLFPGYVFSRFDVTKRLPVLLLPGVVHVVGTRNGPTAVSEEELNAIRRFLDSGLPIMPWPYIAAGDTVEVQHGVLSGLRGIVVRVDRIRLVVSLTLLQRSVAVELDRDAVTPVTRHVAHAA